MTKTWLLAPMVLVLTGCITQRSASVTALDGEKSLQFKQVTTGLLAGPCIPAFPGRIKETYWIKLQGDGPTYSITHLTFVDAKGVSTPGADLLRGDIRLDRAKHSIVVSLFQGSTPMPFNGHYKYKGEI